MVEIIFKLIVSGILLVSVILAIRFGEVAPGIIMGICGLIVIWFTKYKQIENKMVWILVSSLFGFTFLSLILLFWLLLSQGLFGPTLANIVAIDSELMLLIHWLILLISLQAFLIIFSIWKMRKLTKK